MCSFRALCPQFYFDCNKISKTLLIKSIFKKVLCLFYVWYKFNNSCYRQLVAPQPLPTMDHQGQVCHKTFPTLSKFKPHSHIHSVVKPVDWRICGKTFSITGNLCQHPLIHTEVQPFSCNYCDHPFSQSDRLKTHLKVHSGKKSNSCFKCAITKSFSSSQDLICHNRIHTGEKP